MSIQNPGPAEQQACTGYIFQSTNCPDAQISHDNLCQDTYHGHMATMNVSLPEELKKFVEAQVDEHGYISSSEFVRELIRREQDRTQLRAQLLQGLRSGSGSEMDDDYFERMRERIRVAGAA